mgnify:CR=1 FL=1
MPQGTNARPGNPPDVRDEQTSNTAQSQTDRVAELHGQAAADYATGQAAREGMDRADALRREMWGTSATSPGTPS